MGAGGREMYSVITTADDPTRSKRQRLSLAEVRDDDDDDDGGRGLEPREEAIMAAGRNQKRATTRVE